MKHDLILVGGGSGAPEYLLPIAKEALEKADCVFASERFASIIPLEKREPMGNLSALLERLPERLERENIAIVVSGDPLLYSLCRSILQQFPEWSIQIVPGIGSLQLLGAAFGLTMEHAAIRSIHGRTCTAGSIACAVSQNETTFFFCSQQQGPKEIAEALCAYQLQKTEMFVGSDLGCPTQKLFQRTPEQWSQKENPKLCVTAVKNPNPKRFFSPALLPDSAFLRNTVPMTKEEVRAVVLSKLHLKPDAIVWDIGAGTGSISIECARMCPFGCVCAVEYKESALEILQKNKALFQLENLQIFAGRAEREIDALPLPDCVFIGGSEGKLSEILQKIQALPQKVRVVTTAVTMETQGEAYRVLSDMPMFDAMQITISRTKVVGNYRILDGGHPVMLFSCETKE